MNPLDPSGRRRDSEYFGDGDRNYFLDVVKTGEDRHHLAITRTDRNIEGKGFAAARSFCLKKISFYLSRRWAACSGVSAPGSHSKR